MMHGQQNVKLEFVDKDPRKVSEAHFFVCLGRKIS